MAKKATSKQKSHPGIKRDRSGNLTISHEVAVEVLMAIGFVGAAEWTADRCLKKIARLGTAVPDPSESGAEGKTLTALEMICTALTKDKAVVIADDEKPAKKSTKSTKSTKSKKAEPVEEPDEDEEDEDEEDEEDDESEDDESEDDEDEDEEDESEDEEDEEDEEDDESEDEDEDDEEDESEDEDDEEDEEDEEDEPAPAKKSTKKSTKSTKAKGKGSPIQKVGIIDEILAIVNGTKRGLTKADILEKLAKKFPDRDAEKMKATVSVQVPYFLNNKRNAGIIKLPGNKYVVEANYTGKEAAPAKKSTKKSSTKKAAPSKANSARAAKEAATKKAATKKASAKKGKAAAK
jgi:hypothetical protein